MLAEAAAMKYPVKIAAAMSAYFSFTAVYQNYISVFFKNYHQLQDGEVGVLMAIPPIVSLIAQPVWGTISDRARSKNRVLQLMYICGALLIAAYLFKGSLWYLLPMVCAYSFFFTAMQPLNDTIVLESLNGKPFGPVRMAGTLAFALISPLAGTVIGTEWSRAIYLSVGMMLFAMCMVFLVPNVPGHQSGAGRQKMNFSALLKQKDLMRLLIFVTPLQITMGYFYTYFQPHFLELEGADSTLLGLCYTISSLAEVPFLLLSSKLYHRFGAGRLLITAGISITIRWLLVGTLTNVYAVMATQLFHGWGFIVMTVTMANYIHDHVPDELKASGQMLLGVVAFGIARAAGNLGGVLCVNMVGKQHTFYIAAAISGIAVLINFRRYFIDGRAKE